MSDEPITEGAPTRAEELTELLAHAFHQGSVRAETENDELRAVNRERRLEDMEQEARPLLQAVVGHFLERDDLTPGLKEVFTLMVDPENQWNAIAQVLGVFGAILAFFSQVGSIEIRKIVNSMNATYAFVPVSPADASDAVVRNVYTEDEGVAMAAQSGLGADNFKTLVAITGEPPGPIEMLSLWRRGIIDEEFLDMAIRYSRIRDDFIPSVKALAHSYMSPVDAINILIKGLVDHDTAKKMFVTAGGLEDQFDLLYEAYGNSIGPMSAINLWNHKLVTEADVDKVLERSRINPMFYPIAKLQRHKWLGIIQIEAALKSGAVDAPTAIEWMIQDGYDAEQADTFATALATGGTAKAKSETEALIVEQYSQRLLSAADAQAALAQLGYPLDAANALLGLADAKVAHSQRSSAIAAVRVAYELGRITDAEAKRDLVKLGEPPAAVEQWVSDWQVAGSARGKTFTMAEIGGFAKKGIITYANAMTRWEKLGYSKEDALILAANYGDQAALKQLQGSPA